MITRQIEALRDLIAEQDSVAIAFSGGVDSTLLASVAQQALGERALAVTVRTPYIPRWEIEEAKQLARLRGIRHLIIDLPVPESVINNPADRCYLCKQVVFQSIIKAAKEQGIEAVFDGTNADDLKDYRPGLRALAELNVRSPLQELGFDKDTVRAMSRELALPTWDKPAYACLLTRIPYDTQLNESDFRMIEQAEVFMIELGFRAVRVRKFGDLAKIEVARETLPRLLDIHVFDKIVYAFKEIGFAQVALDMAGYRIGSMNDQLRMGGGNR
ncbi:MAG TPA: ATP-dependent sacrificial sulfur transferase LarE [Bacillota bacterium]|nr:ATP-dependent sacrificial sulfur transferase LarE [Bacillota bacterium]